MSSLHQTEIKYNQYIFHYFTHFYGIGRTHGYGYVPLRFGGGGGGGGGTSLGEWEQTTTFTEMDVRTAPHTAAMDTVR